jgi:hypothetical protein
MAPPSPYAKPATESRLTFICDGARMAIVLALLEAFFGALLAAMKPRASLVAENLALRQQLAILRRITPRPRLRLRRVPHVAAAPVGPSSRGPSRPRLEKVPIEGIDDRRFRGDSRWIHG